MFPIRHLTTKIFTSKVTPISFRFDIQQPRFHLKGDTDIFPIRHLTSEISPQRRHRYDSDSKFNIRDPHLIDFTSYLIASKLTIT